MSYGRESRLPNISRAELHKTFDFRARKFGRNDLQERQNISRDVSIGNSEIGGVSVDCRFIFSKTRLGVLENENEPGGIIYMDLAINQPSKWRLREANISIILDDAPMLDRRSAEKRNSPEKSVEFFQDCYGPKHLVGPELVAEATRNYKFGPQVEAMGFGGSLGEFGSNITQTRTSWWDFQGASKPANAKAHQYTKLTWTMCPNPEAYTTDHPTKFATAFAFSHSYQPFLLRVEIDGKLRHRHQQYKDKAIGLFTKAKREKPIMLLFKLDSKDLHTSSILDQARNLETEMAKVACQRQSTEVSPRVSSAELLTDKLKQCQYGEDSMIMREEVDPTTFSSEEIDLIGRLQKAHNTIMKDEPLQIFPKVPPPATQAIVAEKAIAQPVKPTSAKELAETLQSMPTLVLWMLNFFVQFLTAMSTTSLEKRAK